MHRVDRAVGGSGREHCPGRGGGNAKAGLLALHIAARLISHGEIHYTALCKLRRGRLLIYGNDRQRHAQAKEHCHKNRDALFLFRTAAPNVKHRAAGMSRMLIISSRLV